MQMKNSFVRNKGGGEGEQRGKQQNKSLIQVHQQMLKNIMSTNIGKPTIVEAQRILKILDGLYDNLLKFIYLDADFIQKFHKAPKELVAQLSQEGRDLLNHQVDIEAKIKTPLSWKQEAFQEGVQMDEDKQQDYDRMNKQLQQNFQNLLRHMQTSPDFEIIKGMQTGINPEWNDLVHCIHCQKIIMLKKLSTAAEEKEQHKTQLEFLQTKILQLEDSCQTVQRELDQLQNNREKHNKEKKEEIQKLKNDIADVQLDQQQKLDEINLSQQKALEQLEKDFKQKEDEENKFLNETIKMFDKMQSDHLAEEQNLKRKKTTADNGMEENIRAYDEMMKEKYNEMSELKKEYTKINEELSLLKEKITTVEKEKAREQEVQREFQKKEDAWKLQNQKKEAAIRHIQTIFRAYKQVSQRKQKRGKKGKQ